MRIEDFFWWAVITAALALVLRPENLLTSLILPMLGVLALAVLVRKLRSRSIERGTQINAHDWFNDGGFGG